MTIRLVKVDYFLTPRELAIRFNVRRKYLPHPIDFECDVQIETLVIEIERAELLFEIALRNQ